MFDEKGDVEVISYSITGFPEGPVDLLHPDIISREQQAKRMKFIRIVLLVNWHTEFTDFWSTKFQTIVTDSYGVPG
jgi:hypothetical protein